MLNKAAWIGFFSLLWKEVLRYLKVASQTILSPVISSALYMLIFGVSLGPHIQRSGALSYLEFLVPGLLAMTCLNNALQNSASSIIISKFHNDLQDLRTVPLSSLSITLAYALASWTRGLVCALAVYLVGVLLVWISEGSFLAIQHPFVLLYFVSAGSIFFGCLGIWAGFWANSFDQINVVTQFIVLPLIYLGGVFYSIEMLPDFWRDLTFANPLVYLINGIRWSFLSISDIQLSTCVFASLGFLVFAVLLAWRGVSKGDYMRF